MFLFYFSMSLTVISNTLYHVFQKSISGTVNPVISLAMTYVTATLACLVILPFYPLRTGLVPALKELNWASFALAFALVGLELGFLLAYRAGWKISLGAIVSNVAVTLLLVPVGLLFFKEHLSPIKLIGVLVCLAGLVLVNYK